MRPPNVKASWDECSHTTQALILAFDQVCDRDELHRDASLAGVDLK